MWRPTLACLLLTLSLGCSSGGGGGGGRNLLPAPEWARFGADSGNSRTGFAPSPGEGVLRWSFDLGGSMSGSPAIGPTGIVFAATVAGRVVAIDPSGALLWEFDDDGRLGAVNGSIAADQNGIIYFGTDDGFVFALDPQGQEIWRFDTQTRPGRARSAVRTSPLLEVDGIDDVVSALFFGADDGRFFAIGGEEGGLRWELQTSGPVAADAAADINGILYAASSDGLLYGLTRQGSVVFELPVGEVDGVLTSAPLTRLSTVFQPGLASGDGGKVVAVTSAGTPRWSFETASPVRASGAQTASARQAILIPQLVVVDQGGEIFLLDQSTGRPSGTCFGGVDEGRGCWNDANCEEGVCDGAVFFSVGETVVASPATTSDGTIVIATAPGDGSPGRVMAIMPKSCFSGERAGDPCRVDADCDGDPDGECGPETDDPEAIASIRWSFSDSRCEGGSAGGLSCATDADCPGDPPGSCDATLPAVRSSPSIARDGTVYFAADNQRLYALGSAPEEEDDGGEGGGS